MRGLCLLIELDGGRGEADLAGGRYRFRVICQIQA